MTRDHAVAFAREFAQHREFLWGLCYRMTGSAADADDLVQDTFERALRHPPADIERSVRPWLSRVAINLSCDYLRRRKLQPYRGTWLPEPVPTATLRRAVPETVPADARYELLESTTLAFLLALEALSPVQRAVLLLRDVFDYSVRETAEALEQSEANVKTSLHRARLAMTDYDAQRCLPSAAVRKQTARTLQLFLMHLATDNVRGIEALLRDDVVTWNDPGDDFVAARKAVIGRQKVLLFFRKVSCLVNFGTKQVRVGMADLNGLPSMVGEYVPSRRDFAPRQVFSLTVDSEGQIAQIFGVLAPGKIERIDFGVLRRMTRLELAITNRVRNLLVWLQAPAVRLSRHIQVHPGSRARR